MRFFVDTDVGAHVLFFRSEIGCGNAFDCDSDLGPGANLFRMVRRALGGAGQTMIGLKMVHYFLLLNVFNFRDETNCTIFGCIRFVKYVILLSKLLPRDNLDFFEIC